MKNIRLLCLIALCLIISAVSFAQAFFGAPSTPRPVNTSGSLVMDKENFQQIVDKLGQEHSKALTENSKQQFEAALNAPLPPTPSPVPSSEPPSSTNTTTTTTPVAPSVVIPDYSTSNQTQTTVTNSTTTSGSQPAAPGAKQPAQIQNQPYTGFSGQKNNSSTETNRPSGFNIQY